MENILETDFMQIFDEELLFYLAHRYHKSPQQIVSKYLVQDNIENPELRDITIFDELDFALEANEMEILRDYYNRYEKTNN